MTGVQTCALPIWLFGGIVVSVLCPAIGVIGTYVVAVILCIICLVIITEKSFIRSVKKGSEKAYSSAKQDAKKRKEQAELRREKRAQEREQKVAAKERKRKDNTVSGVSFDTTLVKKSPEMREITPPEEVPDLFAEEIPSYDGREAEVSKKYYSGRYYDQSGTADYGRRSSDSRTCT